MPKAGLFATLASLLGLTGTGAPKAGGSGLSVRTIIGATVLTMTLGSIMTASPAWAETPGPGWELSAQSFPTNLPPGSNSGFLLVKVLNIGAAASSGQVTVTDTLPRGLEAIEAGELASNGLRNSGGPPKIGHQLWQCSGTRIVTCVNSEENMPRLAGGGGGPQYDGSGSDPRLRQLDPQIVIAVRVTAGPGVESNVVTIAGGGAKTPASTTEPVTISSSPPSGFQVVGWDGWFSNPDGTIDTQAGSHPYAATFVLNFATEFTQSGAGGYLPVLEHGIRGEVRNVEPSLPPGFVGNPGAIPQCTNVQLIDEVCPASAQVGLLQSVVAGRSQFLSEVYNMVPPPGVPAEFATVILGVATRFDATVRSGGDYGISEHINNIPRAEVVSNVLTLWGVPADPSHDIFRTGAQGGCKEVEGHLVPESKGKCAPSTAPLKPFLTLPTSCGAPQPFSIRANTWQDETFSEPATFYTHDANGSPVGFTGCEHLGFGPAFTTAPDTSQSDTPAGLTVEVRPSVGGLEEPEGVSTADIRDTRVTLPQGFVINPGQAAGLQACQPSQAHVGDGSDDAPACPLASKIGTDEIETPLLPHSLKGNVYILQSNPPKLEMLVAASGEGVNLKLVGEVHLNEQTGQLESTFKSTPALPFTDFKLSFSGGAQAALDTPTQCGTYESTSDFTPWGSPFVADLNPTASFGITTGPGGAPCPSNPLPFAPSMIAGSTTDQAGAFTNFSLLLQRGDGQQRIEKLQFREPAGLAGLISSVPLCDEAHANAGTCPAASHIGHAVVTSGPGPYPLVLPQPGAPELPIYLTGPYKGAPFGLSIVTPVIAGPFNLGTVITRAKIEVDPHTAQITITTDPLPQIVDGVPTDLRSINSIIDRPGFLFNPTNCNPAEFTGTAWGTPPPGAGGPGATAQVSSHFGVGSCRELGFTPTVAVSTGAKASKLNGASLSFNISYPKGALGRESWFNEAKFVIPKQLPSRLTTLQKACLASVFETNPAACPPASLIGHATVHTPVLPVPLQGPVYFVSYGGAAFPNVVLLLQGYGVTIDLVGETFISKGVTSATFRNTPDVPFENFEVTIPTGPYSEFGTNLPHESYDFCGQKLLIPTLFKAQNGLEIHQNTPVAVTGCPKPLTAKQKLAAALKACHKKHGTKRATCEKAARKAYGAQASKTHRKRTK
jgi:hypothetical protein